MNRKISEKEILKTLLLCCQCYQDTFERTLYKHEIIDFMNHCTVQGGVVRTYAKRLSKIDLSRINTIQDLINEVNKEML